LLTVIEIRQISGGDIAVCRREDAPADAAPFLVRTRDLDLRAGDLARIPPTVRELLVRRGRLDSELRRQRRDAAESNPHAERYKTATAEYKAFIAEVTALTAARDGATGDERMRSVARLHEMKNREPEVRGAYETAKRQYTEWKTAHADGDAPNPAIAGLRERLDEVTRALSRYFDS
jgi:hypothetical protein